MANALEQSDLPLAEKLGHALNRISLAMRADSWQATSEEGLNPTQGKILTLLGSRSGGLRLGDIATELAVSAPTVSDSVGALIEKGLVKKERANDDGRAIAVTLLPAGRLVAKKMQSGGDSIGFAIELLPDDEREQLYRSIIKLIRGLQVAKRIPVARMCVTCQYFRPRVHDDDQRPHHCALVDAAFGDRTIREDCPEHQVADEHLAEQNWKKFTNTD